MVHFLKRVVPIVLVAAVLTAAIVSPAAAASEKPAPRADAFSASGRRAVA